MDNTRGPPILRQEYYSELLNNYISLGPSYGEITGDNHSTNYSCDDDYLKPSFCKKHKIDVESNVECQFEQKVQAQHQQICSSSAVGVLDDDNLESSSFPNRIPKEPLRGILKVSNAYNKQEDRAKGDQCLTLTNMKPNLQNANMTDYETHNEDEDLLYNRKRSDRYSVLNDFLQCKLAKGEQLSPHVEKMIDLFERLRKLGSAISQELAIDIILRSLPPEYVNFITVFLKCDLDITVYQLHEKLKTVETQLRVKNPINAFLAPEKEGIKKRAKKKGTGKGNIQIKKPDPKPKRGAKNDDVCHYCNDTGHWKRNCRKYLKYMKKNDVHAH